jgi:hypothetical protein
VTAIAAPGAAAAAGRSAADARFVEVPGIEGVADFFALPEVQQSVESLGRTSA